MPRVGHDLVTFEPFQLIHRVGVCPRLDDLGDGAIIKT